jgi:hypothetical protein
MKKIELNQIENLEVGKGGFVTGFICGNYILTGAVLAVGTGAIGAALGAMGCGWSVGHGLETGSWC